MKNIVLNIKYNVEIIYPLLSYKNYKIQFKYLSYICFFAQVQAIVDHHHQVDAKSATKVRFQEPNFNNVEENSISNKTSDNGDLVSTKIFITFYKYFIFKFYLQYLKVETSSMSVRAQFQRFSDIFLLFFR